jgi:hypothetical protein
MRAIFIHSGWRTGSTYVWTKFRQDPACLGFYEPFNEMLSAMSPTDIYTARHDLAALKHSEIGLPYFHEYIPLLGAKGHALFKLEFSYRNYFIADEPLPDQRAYIESMLGLAGKLGRRPVLGFVRSLGRVGWFRKNFTDAANIVVIRSPVGQWLSARQLALQHQHEFFDPMQLLIFAQARGSMAIIEEGQRLGIPRLDGHPLSAAIELARQLSAKLNPADRFRIFASLYVLSYLAALPNADLVIDMDRLSVEAAYQAETARAIHALAGLDVEFSDAAMPRRADPDVDLREALADIRARLPGMKPPHDSADAGRETAARELLARKLADDAAALGP